MAVGAGPDSCFDTVEATKGRGMADLGLKGKVAIVTGAGSRADGIGNGRAAAILLAREGVKVGLIDAVLEPQHLPQP